MKFRLKFVVAYILLTMFFSFGYAQSKNIYINTLSVVKISDDSVWLTGSINNIKDVNDYGFAISNFPLPPLEGQTVDYYNIKGKPIQGYNFTYCLTNLDPGQHYFVATYYKKGNSYYYADNNAFSTSRAVKITVPEINIEVSNDLINVPINFEKSLSYIAGQITLEFDSEILNFKELKLNGLEEVYQKSITKNSSGDSTFIHLGWCSENDLDLKDLKLIYQFQLNENIESSGNTSIEIIEMKLINNLGQNIPTKVINGSINYQLKQQINNLIDKNFNDSDLIYLKQRNENCEYVEVVHNSQFINSRWIQAKSFFDNNKLPIRIKREYQVSETKPVDGRPLYEGSSFIFNYSQKKDIINSNCSLHYYSDIGVNLIFSETSLQTLKNNNQPWKITIMPINNTEIDKIQVDYNKIYHGWNIETDINQLVEIRFPIKNNINKDKLRINAIYENGHNINVVPNYLIDNKQEYAYIMVEPNALFVLAEPKEHLFTTKLLSKQVISGYKTYQLSSASYLESGHLMLPLELMEKCFGFQVSWQNGDNKVFINDGRSIILSLDSQVVVVDLQALFLRNKAKIKNNSIYVSEDFLKTILNADINYNQITKEISIKY